MQNSEERHAPCENPPMTILLSGTPRSRHWRTSPSITERAELRYGSFCARGERKLNGYQVFPAGSMMNRSITIRSGQCHVHRYMKPLLERIRKGEIDPTFVITHRMSLEDAPKGYDIFNRKLDGCEKIVLKAN